MDERTRLFWLFLAGGLAIGGIALAVPHTFQADTVISASQMNANFADLEVRLARLESAGIGVPTGTVVAFAGPKNAVPEGWEVCDGRQLRRSDHPVLFAAIGTVHGHGDGATTFHLPDYRGRFIRGVDDGAGRDPDANTRTAAAIGGNPGNVVGSVQVDAFQGHRHRIQVDSGAGNDGNGVRVVATSSGALQGLVRSTNGGETTFSPLAVTGAIVDAHGAPRTSTETRPTNAYVYYIIKL